MMILLLCFIIVSTNLCSADTLDPVINEIEENIIAQLYGPLDRVLVCLNQDARNQLISTRDLRPYLYFEFSNINIEYHENISYCHREIEKDEQQAKTIIAAVVPKPFKLSSNVPMYFYDIPYLLEDDDADAFPNAMAPVYRHSGWLKHAFIQHLTSNGWTRVAIVSDYSNYSEAFETELVGHFKKNEFVYSVQRCVVVNDTDNCNFYEPLKFLRDHKAVIIIANVEGQNAQNLANAAHELSMKSDKYVWLVRGWPFQDTESQEFKHIISISMSPIFLPQIWVTVSPDEDGPHLNSIWRGLHLISEAVNVTKKEERIDKYYKSIFQKMNKVHYYEYTGYIRNFASGGTIINKLFISEAGVTGSMKGSVRWIADYEDENCMLKSDSSYTNPCDDNFVMLICVVWLMFLLMMVLLIFFFNRCLVWT